MRRSIVKCFMIGELFFAERDFSVYPAFDAEANWMTSWTMSCPEKTVKKDSPFIVVRVDVITRRSKSLERIVTLLCTHGVCVTWIWMLSAFEQDE